MNGHTLQCIICDKVVKTSDDTTITGTVFTAAGNYGSGVWDPMNSRKVIQAFICDECLQEAITRSVVLQRTEESHPTFYYEVLHLDEDA